MCTSLLCYILLKFKTSTAEAFFTIQKEKQFLYVVIIFAQMNYSTTNRINKSFSHFNPVDKNLNLQWKSFVHK